MSDIRNQEQAEKTRIERMELTEAVAAVRIQKIWRGHMARRKVERLREEELIFIGMMPPPEFPVMYQKKLEEVNERRRQIQVRLISSL